MQRIDVQFADGRISVDATNASLNEVLRQVSAKAGIKLTGSVTDERVFGHYGPATPAVILATLIDGTGSNMLLVDDPKGASELILTLRRGGPTPPNPNSAVAESASDEDRPASRYVPPVRPYQPASPGRGPFAVAPNPQSQGTGTNQTEPSQAGSNPTSQDPGTTQQIFDQLQKTNQQSQAPPQ